MAKSRSPKKLMGIALLVVGAGLIVWGLQKSDGLESQLSNAITGSHSDNVMLLFIAGAACLAVGFFVGFKK